MRPARRGFLHHAATAASALAAAGSSPGCAYRHFAPIPYTPLLFAVRAPDAPGEVALFGGLHSGLPRFYPLPETVERVFAGSHALLIEVDLVTRAAAIRRATSPVALLPDGRTLDQVLSPEVMAALRSHYRTRPWDWEDVRRLQPWALTLLLPNVDDVRLEANANDGLDRTLLRRARDAGKPVFELEAAEAQIGALAGGSWAEQEAALALRLAQLQSWDRTYTRIVYAWRTGDAAALAALKDRAYPPYGPLAALRERLFSQRDERWVQPVVDVLQQPQRTFVLVGVLHLAGADSLQHALGRRGLDVQALAYG